VDVGLSCQAPNRRDGPLAGTHGGRNDPDEAPEPLPATRPLTYPALMVENGEGLALRASKGNPAAFGALLERHGLQVLLFVRRFGKGALRADCSAEDMVQTVALQAWEARERFVPEGPGAFHRWLVGVARNVIGDRLRYLEGKGRGDVLAGGASVAAELRDSVTSLLSRIARREDLERIEECLDGMDEADRTLVEAVWMRGESLRHVALELGIGKSTAWTRLERALEAIRRQVGPGGRGAS
jgi:RNA polymerase sigma factor (sigma-70 family)